MADREEKGKTKIQKFEHLENQKSFSDEIKSIFLAKKWFGENNEK